MFIEIKILDKSTGKSWNDIINFNELQDEKKRFDEYGLRIIDWHQVLWQELASDHM